MEKQWSTIFSAHGEKEKITLFGKQESDENWVYRKSIGDISDGEEVSSWEVALQQLEDYPWYTWAPQEVHPAFGKKVYRAVKEKLNTDVEENVNNLVSWAKRCFSEHESEIVTLAVWLQHAKHTTVLTGAGMSTESGIPDFRSKGGIWRDVDPQYVASVDALNDNYDMFHEFYTTRMNALTDVNPHRGHEILAEWEKEGLVQAVATQNIDGLHFKAGSKNVFELHGTIHRLHCDNCLKETTMEQFFKKEACSKCGGKLRPSIVLFGEMLPEDSWSASFNHIQQSDLVVVIGTSLQVHPVNRLPEMTEGKTVYINLESNGGHFDLVINGKAGEVLIQVDEVLKQM